MERTTRFGVAGSMLLALVALGASAASCSLDAAGTATAAEAPLDAFADASESGADVEDVVTDTCIPEAGSACNSPALCFTGTVECDGRCNAPPDPPGFGSSCTTPKGCTGKYDCDGSCIGEPLATGAACTTANGCPGKQACDESCVGDPPNYGKSCATPKGCTSKFDCAGKCPENTLVDKACKTANLCDRRTDCLGKCNEDPNYGKACKTAKGCNATLGCDLKCPADDPKVGTACSVNGCPSTFDCALACPVTAGAGADCVSATCAIATKKNCAGVCPDPKPGDTTKVCNECDCAGGKVQVREDQCGKCAACTTVCAGTSDAGTTPKDGGPVDGG